MFALLDPDNTTTIETPLQQEQREVNVTCSEVPLP